MNAQELQALADLAAGQRIVLADAAGEHDGVQPAHGGSVGADVLADLVGQHIHRQLGPGIAALGGGADVTVVAADAGHAQQAGLLVHHRVHFGGGHAGLLHEIAGDGGVHVTGAGAHQQAAQGGHAHAGIQHLAAVHRGDGGAVAQVAGDDLHVLGFLAQVVGHGQGHVAVRGAVEAVAPHAVLLVVLIGQAVHIGPGGHGGVEGGVEHQHVGDLVAKHLAGAAQALDAGGVVQGGQGGQLLVFGDDLIGHQHALVEGLAAMDAPVADGADLTDVVNGLALAGGHLLHHLVEGLHMGGHGAGLGPLLTVLLMGDAAALVADALAQTLAQQLLIVHVDELILQGRGTAVDDQNVHKNISFFCDFK